MNHKTMLACSRLLYGLWLSHMLPLSDVLQCNLYFVVQAVVASQACDWKFCGGKRPTFLMMLVCYIRILIFFLG